MDITNPSTKKMPFTTAEKEYLIELVTETTIIENKGTNSSNINKKKQAWLDVARQFNYQSFTTNRTDFQLKRCWENMKTLRKKELACERNSIMRTGGGPPEPATSANLIDIACPHIDLCVPGAIDSNRIMEFDGSMDIMQPVVEVSELGEPARKRAKVQTAKGRDNIQNITNEAEARLHRILQLTRHEEELHVIRKRKEQLMMEREEVLLIKAKEDLEHERAKRLEEKNLSPKLHYSVTIDCPWYTQIFMWTSDIYEVCRCRRFRWAATSSHDRVSFTC